MFGKYRRAGSILTLLVFFTLSACATHSEVRRKMVTDVRCGAYKNAERRLADLAGEREKDVLMDVMDEAMILHLEGRYKSSNAKLERAKELIDGYFTVDISDELAAIAWNDTERAYQGEEFERVMVHMLSAFNYLQMGLLDEAAVEARQINHKLQVYADKLAANKVKTSYTQDPFAQYLAGMIQEASGEYNDALLSYRDAYKGYLQTGRDFGIAAPPALRSDLMRAAMRAGNDEAYLEFKQNFPNAPERPVNFVESHGRLVVISSVGRVAQKYSAKWIIPDPELDTFVIYYPKFGKGKSRISHVTVSVDGKEYRAQPAHNLTSLAKKTLDEKSSQVKGRAVVKAIAMYAAKKVTKKLAKHSKSQTTQTLSILANIALNVADLLMQADTRSWMSLPDKIGLASMYLKPGHHTVSVNFLGSGWEMLDRQVISFDIKAGQTRFWVTRSREPHPEGKRPDPSPKPIWNKRKSTPKQKTRSIKKRRQPVSMLIND